MIQASHNLHRATRLLAGVLGLALAGAVAAQALVPLKSGPLSGAAAAQPQVTYRHAVRSANARLASRSLLEVRKTSLAAAAPAESVSSSPDRYPADLSYLGGPVVTSLESHAIFVNPSSTCPLITCWGDPLQFLHDLGRSHFVHVIDPLVGATASNRYTLGTNYYGSFAPASGTIFTDADIQNVVAAAVAYSAQSGYTHEYHVFLPQGTDLCFDSTLSVCYSPDNFPTFVFCAYHGSFDIAGVGHVLYSAEPYQNVPGCQDTGATPNGALADSTNSVLSHELFETITDPDGDAWINVTDNGMYGEEIGDECSFVNATGFDPSVWQVDGHTYATQPEYLMRRHACTVNP